MNDIDDSEEVDALVIDNGSWTIKAGYAGSDVASATFRSHVGYPKYEGEAIESTLKDFFDDEIVGSTLYSFIQLRDRYIGPEVKELLASGFLKEGSPFDRNKIINWDEMELIWGAAYELCGTKPTDQHVLHTERPVNAKADRVKYCEIMFEKFNVPGFYISPSALLSLYASGRTNGCVVDFGHSTTDIVPIDQGYVIPISFNTMNVAGHDITLSLQDFLKSKRSLSLDYDTVSDVKEGIFSHGNTTYQLPDGTSISTNEDLDYDNCIDVLFKPKNGDGISQMIMKAVTNIGDPHVSRRDMYKNIVFAGGTSLLEERYLYDRVVSELTQKINCQLKIIRPPERKISQWIGGSILASLSTFQEMWVTSAEYAESGPTIVHRKCL